jgi:hypothetical protein
MPPPYFSQEYIEAVPGKNIVFTGKYNGTTVDTFMHVLHAVHVVRPAELQVDPESQLVAAFTIVNPKRPCEERRG